MSFGGNNSMLKALGQVLLSSMNSANTLYVDSELVLLKVRTLDASGE